MKAGIPQAGHAHCDADGQPGQYLPAAELRGACVDRGLRLIAEMASDKQKRDAVEGD
jgi:hypothetical protein